MPRTDLSDEKSEAVEVAQAVCTHSQLPDALVELVSPLVRVLLVGLGVILSEESPVLSQQHTQFRRDKILTGKNLCKMRNPH